MTTVTVDYGTHVAGKKRDRSPPPAPPASPVAQRLAVAIEPPPLQRQCGQGSVMRMLFAGLTEADFDAAEHGPPETFTLHKSMIAPYRQPNSQGPRTRTGMSHLDKVMKGRANLRVDDIFTEEQAARFHALTWDEKHKMVDRIAATLKSKFNKDFPPERKAED